MKRVVASMLILLQLLLLVPVQVFAEEETTVIIHYVEAEDNDKDWNLWIWPDGGEGSVYEFTEEDNFGRVARVVLAGNHQRVGFIVRTDAWEKDTPSDRFIEQFDGGVGEIWVVGGQENFYYENPNGPDGIQSEAVDLAIHYNNYDGDYSDLNVTAYVNDSDKVSVEMSSEDFGVSGSIRVDNTLDQPEVYVAISDRGQTNIFGVKKIKDGVAEVYLVENNERVFYSKEDAVYQPVVTEAKLMDTKTIKMSANMPFKLALDDITVLVNGMPVELEIFDFDTFNTQFIAPEVFTLKLKDSVSYTDEIVVKLPKFESAKVQLGDVYDTFEFNSQFNYDGALGPIYTEESTTFKVWAPTAQDVDLVLYDKYDDNEGLIVDMTLMDKGVWTAEVMGDLHNQLYDYAVKHQNDYIHTVDPYAKAVTVNGIKSAVVDLERTNPDNWDDDYKTNFTSPVDAIMYEIHVRDLSMHNDSGIEHKGLFLGFTELDTQTKNGFSTGLSYIKDLGVTHIQLLPIYDYGSIDESKNDYQFNWGYDPVNYNALEGSYSSDPYTPDVRINEFKQAVQAIHDQDLKVTMDVVYNHVYSLNAMAFEKLVPGYYFRKEASGNYANGSGCGNETASERYMMQKFMVDSVVYLADEYNLDGFRFDLMGLHDVTTMNMIRTALDEIDPSITIIGEGWNMGIVLDENLRSNQNQASEMPGIAHFNDTIRDGLKGSVFDSLDQGFVNGKSGMAGIVFSGIVGGVDFDTYTTWGGIDPTQSVTYVEAHDNNTLFDKLEISNPDDDLATLKKMHMLTDSIVLTSQGVTFIHAGQEFMRTKFGDHNSYKSSDIINRLDWKRREKYDDVVTYFKDLIDIRMAHPAFRLQTSEAVNEHLTLIQASDNVVAYTLTDVAGDAWSNILVIHNANREDYVLDLPLEGAWTVVVDGAKVNAEGLEILKDSQVLVDDLSTMVLFYGDQEVKDSTGDTSFNGMVYVFVGGILVMAAIGFVIIRKKNK